MSQILNTLPGVAMSVREVTRMVGSMWDDLASTSEQHPLSEFRASQMNVVLHLGADTEAGEANERFSQAVAFAQDYPCRLIVLVETEEEDDAKLRGKLFSQCYLGQNLRDLCCCEALMLSYPRGLAELVANQASLWLESDLPVYYWLHRVDPALLEGAFGSVLKQARRVVHDRGVDGAAYEGLEVVSAERRRDFAFARILGQRQTIGQMISAFPPAEIVDGLRHVELRFAPGYRGEAEQLRDWIREALDDCLRVADREGAVGFSFEALDAADERTVAMEWSYANHDHGVRWDFTAGTKTGHFRASLPSGTVEQPVHIEPLTGAKVLAEAFFFG
ncbi:MAG: glucose-6-phosphate dehydrogenase assembly protein OpcA [Verrucomicrobiota bacterium]